MILTTLVAATLATGPAADLVRLAPTREDCSTIVQQGVKPVFEKRPDVHVLGAPAGHLVAPRVGGELVGLACARDSIVPVVGDERVLGDLGVPFYIAQDERMLVLEVSNGRLGARLVNGAFRDGEVAAIQARMDDLQTTFNAANR